MPYRTQVQVAYLGGGSPGYNSFNFRVGSGVDRILLQAATDALEQFYLQISSLYPNTATIGTDGVWSGYGGQAGEREDVDGWSVAGGSANEMLPPFVSVGVVWRTEVSTRSGRGRSFLGPVTRSALGSNGNISDSARSVVTAAATQLIAFDAGDNQGAFGTYSTKQQIFRDWVTGQVPADFYSLTTRRD